MFTSTQHTALRKIITVYRYFTGVLATYRKSLCRKQREPLRRDWCVSDSNGYVFLICAFIKYVPHRNTTEGAVEYFNLSWRNGRTWFQPWCRVKKTWEKIHSEFIVRNGALKKRQSSLRSRCCHEVHPRKNRVVGTPLNPNATRDWMLREDLDVSV